MASGQDPTAGVGKLQEAAGWEGTPERREGEAALTVDVEGYEGPLDLLLELARRQKIDLAQISILALAEQYLAFVERVRKLRIELAADYLVMAAWLAYLKSRLLIPDPPDDGEGPTGEELAAQLAFRLQRLEAMREAASRLVNRNRLGRDFFPRGLPEPIIPEARRQYTATLYDLLTAYAAQRQRRMVTQVTIARRTVWSLAEAREILVRLVGELDDWTAMDSFLLAYVPDPRNRATAIASTFAASLELVREGKLAIRQEAAFSPIYMRKGRIGGGQSGAADAKPGENG